MYKSVYTLFIKTPPLKEELFKNLSRYTQLTQLYRALTRLTFTAFTPLSSVPQHPALIVALCLLSPLQLSAQNSLPSLGAGLSLPYTTPVQLLPPTSLFSLSSSDSLILSPSLFKNDTLKLGAQLSFNPSPFVIKSIQISDSLRVDSLFEKTQPNSEAGSLLFLDSLWLTQTNKGQATPLLPKVQKRYTAQSLIYWQKTWFYSKGRLFSIKYSEGSQPKTSDLWLYTYSDTLLNKIEGFRLTQDTIYTYETFIFNYNYQTLKHWKRYEGPAQSDNLRDSCQLETQGKSKKIFCIELPSGNIQSIQQGHWVTGLKNLMVSHSLTVKLRHSQLYITAPGNTPVAYEIYALNGKKLLGGKTQPGLSKIDLSKNTLPSALIVQVKQGSHQLTRLFTHLR